MGHRGDIKRDADNLGPWRFSLRGALILAPALALLAALIWAGWR